MVDRASTWKYEIFHRRFNAVQTSSSSGNQKYERKSPAGRGLNRGWMSWRQRVCRMAVQRRTVCHLLLFLLLYGVLMLLFSFATMNRSEQEHIGHVRQKKELVFRGHSLHHQDTVSLKKNFRNTANGPGKRAKLKNCPGTYSLTIKEQVFQPVDHSQAYVYSAYLDKRDQNKPVIRIIGISVNTDKSHYHCLIKYENGKMFTIPGKGIRMTLDTQLQAKFRFVPFFFTCDIAGAGDPAYVSLTAVPCTAPRNVLRVHVIEKASQEEIPDKVAVCLRTLHALQSPYAVIEFMEFQKLLGVDKIFLYGVENNSDDVGRVIDYYTGTGLVQIVPWALPVNNAANFWQKGDIAIHGQRASNNDCLYRNMNKYWIFLMHDLDEYFVPRQTSDIRSLVTHLVGYFNATKPVASYDFKNCYFCLKEHDKTNLAPQLLSVEKQIRDDCMPRELAWTMKHHPELHHRETNRTVVKKSLVVGHRVVEMGVHGVVSALPDYEKQKWIPPDKAAMHHYKTVQGVECHRLDKTVLNIYGSHIKQRVNVVTKTLGMDSVT